MRNTIVQVLCLACLVPFALGQQPQRSSPAWQDGGVREVVEGIVIPPIPNAPFTATLATETVKYAADGATMTAVNQRRIARDTKGRVYEERWWLVPKNGRIKSKMNWIQIADPKQLTLYNCSTEKKICDLLVFDPTHALEALVSGQKTRLGSRTDRDRTVTWEDLGHRNIAGVETVGTRETTVMFSGTMGNDQPLTFVSEYWHSQNLGINLSSVKTSPFFGKQTFTITDLTSGEPDPQLFELPAGYKVNDQRKDPQISH